TYFHLHTRSYTMTQAITITRDDIFQQVKLSFQIPALIEQIVSRKIIISTATDLGIKVEAEELQKAADNLRLISKLQNADYTWTWLQKHNLSLDDFEEAVFTNVISGKLAEHLFADKVESWFIDHQLDYAGAVIYEVILDDEDLAMELFYSLQAGEMSFPEVAHQYIQDKELRRCGGYRGIVNRKQLKAEISAAVFAAKPPQVLKPITTSKGLHLILVEELIQPELDDKVRYQIMFDLFGAWIKERVEEVEVLKN
ncbi:peptidylprolyl isomerase, partial [Nodularia sp. UHCC 0506]|uniref:peptidylprolyl isomerase n=1 Tax=Nodularia sp. UHCC 0506 TaxID=3110243 RepID=UPI002B21D30C